MFYGLRYLSDAMLWPIKQVYATMVTGRNLETRECSSCRHRPFQASPTKMQTNIGGKTEQSVSQYGIMAKLVRHEARPPLIDSSDSSGASSANTHRVDAFTREVEQVLEYIGGKSLPRRRQSKPISSDSAGGYTLDTLLGERSFLAAPYFIGRLLEGDSAFERGRALRTQLRRASDAIVIDTTNLSLEQVVALALEHVRCARN